MVEYINVLDQDSATTAIDILDVAKEQVATYRAYVGALQNRLTSVITNLTSRSLNQTITKGRIEDADFALESTKLVKHEILSKAASEVVATANKSKEAILSLLQ